MSVLDGGGQAAPIEFQIAKLGLAPGDILVVRSLRPVPPESARHMREYISGIAPEGVEVVVIDSSIELSVLSGDELRKLAG